MLAALFLKNSQLRKKIVDTLAETLEKTEGKELLLFSDNFTSFRLSAKKWTKQSGKWNEIFEQNWTESGKNANSRSSAKVEQILDNFKSIPKDSSFTYEFDMTFPEGIKAAPNPAETGEYGAGFFFMAKNAAAVYGNKSYLLFQEVGTLKFFKAKGETLTELASFDAPTENSANPSNPPQNSEPQFPPTFHYQIQYTPLTGEISLYRNDIFISSYTDPEPLKSGQTIILTTNFTKTSFDNISVKAGTKTKVKAYNTHGDHLGSSSVVTAGLTIDGQAFKTNRPNHSAPRPVPLRRKTD